MNVKTRASALAAALALAGCGVGGVLVGSAGGGGGGGGSRVPPPPPRMSVSLPGGENGSNLVAFKVTLVDPRIDLAERDPRVRITAEFTALDGNLQPLGAWRPMTDARIAASEGTRALALSAEHTFVWNSIVDLGAFQGQVDFRFGAVYEDAEGISRRFPSFGGTIHVDNRLAGTVLGAETRADSDVDTFPIDMRPDGDGFMVACVGGNIVERVGPTGRVDRVTGFGVPGKIIGDGQAPGVAHLPLLFGLDLDAAGNVYTTHDANVVLTNRGTTPLVFGLLDTTGGSPLTSVVPPNTSFTVMGGNRTIVSATVPLGPPLSFARGTRLHPSGALLLLNLGSTLLAVNPQDPADGASTSIVLAGVTIAPGAVETLVGSGSSTADGDLGTDSTFSDANALAVGPDGEVYVSERTPARVRVLNTAAVPVTIGGVSVAPGAMRTVAGGGGPGFGGDGGPSSTSNLDQPGGIDVSPGRVLFIADTHNVLVRAANLGTVPFTFAETTIAPGAIDTVVGGGTSGVGSKARAIRLDIPNAVTRDAAGNLLVADGHRVLFVNGSASTVNAYGSTAGAARVAQVYDAADRGGLLLVEPRAMTAASADVVYFADRASVRVMNLGPDTAVFGGASADPGESAVVGGGAVTGFAGDGGPARAASFSSPSALTTEGPYLVYVADSDNDRIRVLNTDDPRSGPPAQHTALGVPIDAGNVKTVVGGGLPLLAADGDGLAPTAASLKSPQGLALSNDGLLFVADTGHHRIRVVNAGPADVTVAGVVVGAGTIRTVLGGGVAGFTPDGAGPWLVDTPTALAVDRDLLYFADSGNARIRVLNLSGASVTLANRTVAPGEVLTICGNGTRGNVGDFGLSVDAEIDTPRGFVLQTVNSERAALYFTDGAQHVVRMLNLTSDTDLVGALDAAGNVAVTVPDSSIVTLAGGPNDPNHPNAPGFDGDGSSAQAMRFAAPWGIAVTTFGGRPSSLFVADSQNHRIRRFGAPPLVR